MVLGGGPCHSVLIRVSRNALITLRVHLCGCTSKEMEFQFDPAKNKANIAKHDVDMALAEFEFDTAVEQTDDRMDYGETRW